MAPRRILTRPVQLFALGLVLSSSTHAHTSCVTARLTSRGAAYLYYLRFPQDRLPLKLLVGAITAVCLVDTVANLLWAYSWIVRLWGSIPGAGAIPMYALLSLRARPLSVRSGFYVNVFCYATACTLTQGFFAWRLLNLGRQNRPLVGLILLSALVQQCKCGRFGEGSAETRLF